jgi:NAD(P)-dependent dehydrogenase (short-subunit alcohol dehydrogenase family)
MSSATGETARITYAGQVAIVTGAGRGIGRSYALELAQRGAKVVVNDVGGVNSAERPWADQVVDEIRAAGGIAVASYASVATIEGGQQITDTALESFGTVDLVINNAGFLRRGMFADTPLEQSLEVINVHLMGAFYVTQPAWKVMLAKNYGRVLLTSSAASFGMQANSNYVAAKAGLLGLMSALAAEGQDRGICVNAILPYARTMITVDSPSVGPDANSVVGMQAQLRPRMSMASVVAAALYLTSSSSTVNGQAVSTLAGRYARTFPVLSEGWLRDNPETVTVEDFRDHLAQVLASGHEFEPRSLSGELEDTLRRVRALDGTT